MTGDVAAHRAAPQQLIHGPFKLRIGRGYRLGRVHGNVFKVGAHHGADEWRRCAVRHASECPGRIDKRRLIAALPRSVVRRFGQGPAGPVRNGLKDAEAHDCAPRRPALVHLQFERRSLAHPARRGRHGEAVSPRRRPIGVTVAASPLPASAPKPSPVET
jgi:hypothetical protein